MTAPYHLDDDWSVIDGAEQVTLYRRTSDNTFDSGTVIPHAVRVSQTKTAQGDPRLSEHKLPWLLCPAECSPHGEAAPKADDVIQDGDGARWTIDSVRTCPLGSTHHVETTQEV